jgi:hypothetical protein
VASAVIYQPVVDLTALGALTPADGDFFELQDSTGADTDPSITGVTVGLVGAPGLTFRLRYDDPPGEYAFLGYFANDSETRYLKLQGGTVTGNLEIGTTGSLTFEGSTANAFETTVAVVDPTADRTITLPNVTGTVVTTGDTGTVTSTMILDGTIVDGDVNASAAIAGTKISPDFGSQNVVTTGTSSAAALIPTGSSVPTNGVYLPSANNVAISTNGTGRLFVDASGDIGVGTASPAFVSGSGVEIYDASVPRLKLTNSTTGTGSLDGLDIHINNADANIVVRENFPLIFYTNNTERMRLDSNGRLGLGTSSPSNALTIKGAAASNQGIDVVHTNGNTVAQLIHGGSGDEGQLSLLDSNSTTVLIRGEVGAASYFNAGNVGIGSTAPSQKLSVEDAADTYALIKRTTSGSESTILVGAESGKTVIYSRDNTTGGRALEFAIGTSPAARIDTSGRFLVGTSSALSNIKRYAQSIAPTQQIISNDTANWNTGLGLINYSASGYAPVLTLGLSASNTAGTNTLVSADHRCGVITFNGNDGTDFEEAARIEAFVDGTPGADDMPGRLVFSTTADGASSPTERMRIQATGNAGILCASGADPLYLNTPEAAGTSRYFIYAIYEGSTTTGANGTNSFRVYTNGNVQNTNNSYGQISDIKLKENIVDASSQWGDLKAVRVRNFNFKEGQTHRQIGVIAQELEDVSPGLVYETPDRDEEGNETGEVTKGVNYSVLYMKAVKALQEAMERIETLEAKVAALEAS